MADPPKSKAPSKKVVGYSVLAVAGVGVAYYLYTRYEASAATDTTSGAPATTGGTSTGGSPSAAPTPPITNVAQWKQAILNYMVNTVGIKGGENTAATALSDALSGHCLGPNEFAALNAALGSVGQPPGTGTIVLSQCKGAKGTTSTHTPSETPTKVTQPSKVPHPSRAVSVRTNQVDAARRRANDLRAAARRRANQALELARRTPKRGPIVTTPNHRR